MSKRPKLSVVGGGMSPPDDEQTLSQHEVLLPFYPNADDPSECEQYIKRVFDAVEKHYGEDKARHIFAPYGRKRTKREINTQKNAGLLLEYWGECIEASKSKRKPNIRQLARRLAKENNTDSVAMERKIWRVIKDKNVRRYLEKL
jgi:hypothetical protein